MIARFARCARVLDAGASRGRRASVAAILILFSMTSAAAPARAYSTPALYAADPAVTGGAGGRAFTGSPADGYTCGVCHQGEARAEYQLRGGPPGAYALGATYAFELAWPGDRLGLTVEATDLEGRALGSLIAAPPSQLADDERCASSSPAIESIALVDGRAPLGLSECGATRLRLQWTAPSEPIEGTLSLALVVADGDGGPEGDATQVISASLRPSDAAANCSLAGEAPRGPPLLALVGLVIGRRRRSPRSSRARSRSRSCALALAAIVAIAATGCARVQPYERGRLARPDMKMADDRDLDLGPEHALDYREGSAGGLGGAGGGCGCN